MPIISTFLKFKLYYCIQDFERIDHDANNKQKFLRLPTLLVIPKGYFVVWLARDFSVYNNGHLDVDEISTAFRSLRRFSNAFRTHFGLTHRRQKDFSKQSKGLPTYLQNPHIRAYCPPRLFSITELHAQELA